MDRETITTIDEQGDSGLPWNRVLRSRKSWADLGGNLGIKKHGQIYVPCSLQGIHVPKYDLLPLQNSDVAGRPVLYQATKL